MSVRPVGSSPKSSPISQLRKKDAAPGGVESTFAELSAGPLEAAAPGSAAEREPANAGYNPGGDPLANIAAAYLIFNTGSTDKPS